jgi:hypothetical protein
MKTLLVVKADTNDGDYVTETTEIKEKDLPFIQEVIDVINECDDGHNWPTSEYSDKSVEDLYEDKLTPKQIDKFSQYVPFGEYGVHTIKSIRLMKVESDEELIKGEDR